MYMLKGLETHREKVSDDNVPKEKVTLLGKRPVEDSGNLLGADEVPVDKARLETARSDMLVAGRSLDGAHTQRAEGVGIVVLIGQIERGPLEQIEGVNILDDGAVAEILGHGSHGSVLDGRVVDLALGALFDDLGVCQP